jgi:pimeloyl-ACP methyl ester carboxylesterase
MSTTQKTATVKLHREVCGEGPAVLLIAGTPGDGGQFAGLARRLAGGHTVISYDRRGTSRSGAPADWTTTSVGEQADDAAALLAEQGVESAFVFGTSNGAAVALELALRHPDLVSGAVLHEMPLLTVVADPQPIIDGMGAMIGGAMEHGGPALALEDFLRFAFTDGVVDGWDPALRARMLANAGMVFGIELPAFQGYRPVEAELASASVPIHVLVGRDQQVPFFLEAGAWLARRLGTSVMRSPGAHGPQFTCPAEIAQLIAQLAESAVVSL